VPRRFFRWGWLAEPFVDFIRFDVEMASLLAGKLPQHFAIPRLLFGWRRVFPNG
jgi:hypothetical protein